MNVLLLSTPRSGSTYVAQVILNSLDFSTQFLDPLDRWQYKNNLIENQIFKIEEIRNSLNRGNVFIRHNSHFFGIDTVVLTEFEKLFKEFYIIKLIRSNSLFDITLSHCYAMLTDIPHDYFLTTVPTIEIPEELYLQEREVCKTRMSKLLKFEIYDEILDYESVLKKQNTLSKIKLNWNSVKMKKNKNKSFKIKNYKNLYEKYQHDT